MISRRDFRLTPVAIAGVMIAAVVLGTAQAVELPRGEPPQPAATRINVADFGANLADDEHDDTAAVSKAVKAANNNTTLYFPAGTYNVRWVAEIKDFDGLSIQGDGPDKSIIKRMGPYWKPGQEQSWENLAKNYAGDSKLLRIENCRNMCIRDIGLDAHGTPTFGGVGIKRANRLHITNTRYFDSAEQPPFFGRDRFAWIVTGFREGSHDIWFVNNVVEGLQTEMDSTSHVLVERSVFKRSVKSPGLGFLSGNFGDDKFNDGFPNTHITVRRNYFTNSDNLSMGLITFQLDPSTNCNTRFQDVEIVDNVLVYDIDSSHGGHPAIKLGTGDNSQKTTGNVFERFRIEGNRIYRKPTAKINEKFSAYVWFNANRGEERLNHSVIRGNRLFDDVSNKPILRIMKEQESVGLTIEDNTKTAYEEPPSSDQVTKDNVEGMRP